MAQLNNTSNFTIKISDGFCEYQYQLKLSDKCSIEKVAENIAWVLGATKDEGKLIESILDNDKIVE